MKKDPVPIVDDQYTAAQIYFGSILGMILVESMLVMPQYIMLFIKKSGI